MTRELATSRELATREVADRSNQYIKENDWMIWQKAIVNQSYIPSIHESIQYPSPFTIQFLYQFSDQHKASTCIASCVNWPATDGKHRGLIINPSLLYLSSDYVAAERITINYQNLNLCSYKKMLTFVFDGNDSNVYENKAEIKTGITNTCEDFVLESTNWNWGMPGIYYSISQAISHFQVWNKALNATEREYCYELLFSGQSLLGTEDCLVCYFPCQEGSGNLITDIIGGKTGTLSGAEWRDYGGLREAA